MNAAIVKIGNSQGIRLPKSILQLCGFKKEVRLSVHGKQLIVEPLEKLSKEGWSEKFTQMNKEGGDALVVGHDQTSVDRDEWTW